MEVVLPTDMTSKLADALQRAGNREIGGVLMGERLGPNRFRVADLTIHYHSGSFAHFVRNAILALVPLRRFFARAGHDYRRFNYLGEWHSHPAFPVEPSPTDMQSMVDIVEDPRVGALFAVLVIVRLGTGGNLEGTATIFLPGSNALRANLVIQTAT